MGVATGNGLDVYLRLLGEIGNATPEAFNATYIKRVGTEAETVSATMQKLSNAIDIGLGHSVVHVGAEISKMTGGMQGFIEVVNVSGPAVIGLAGA